MCAAEYSLSTLESVDEIIRFSPVLATELRKSSRRWKRISLCSGVNFELFETSKAIRDILTPHRKGTSSARVSVTTTNVVANWLLFETARVVEDYGCNCFRVALKISGKKVCKRGEGTLLIKCHLFTGVPGSAYLTPYV